VLNISEIIKKINKTQQIATKENGGSANKKEHSRPQQLSKKFSLKETNEKKRQHFRLPEINLVFMFYSRVVDIK